MTEEFEDVWEDLGIHMGPFGFSGPRRFVRYSRTENSRILRVRISPEVRKDEIKVRLIKPGVLGIKWPRRPQCEEIPVE